MAAIFARYGKWRRARATRRILAALDDRSLEDVGLRRRRRAATSLRTMLRTLGLR
jgi:uncharacterized protein YjiS (DUF1127 family)